MIHPAEIDDLVVDDGDHVKGLAGRDRVDEDVSVYANGMFGIEDRILVLLCKIRSVSRGNKSGLSGGRRTWPAVASIALVFQG